MLSAVKGEGEAMDWKSYAQRLYRQLPAADKYKIIDLLAEMGTDEILSESRDLSAPTAAALRA